MLNVLHPFREGNGRSQREFIRCLAGRNGFELRWSQVDPKELLKASIEATSNESMLANCIEACIVNTERGTEFQKEFTLISRKQRGYER